jgi:hypothetical protein
MIFRNLDISTKIVNLSNITATQTHEVYAYSMMAK